MIRRLFNKTIPASEGIKQFCENMIANPHDWYQGRHEFINKKKQRHSYLDL